MCIFIFILTTERRDHRIVDHSAFLAELAAILISATRSVRRPIGYAKLQHNGIAFGFTLISWMAERLSYNISSWRAVIDPVVEGNRLH